MHWSDIAHTSVIIATAAVVTAITVIWRPVAKLFRYVFKIDQAMPVLLRIAYELENNGGGSLKDKIDELHTRQMEIIETLAEKRQELEVADRFCLSIAEDSRMIAQTNASIVNELSKSSTTDILHIKEYMHDNMHVIRNQLQETIYYKQQLDKDIKEVSNGLDRLESRFDSLLPYIIRKRSGEET